ncbi:unnamed protein product, partial [Prorocentrum cordatum]
MVIPMEYASGHTLRAALVAAGSAARPAALRKRKGDPDGATSACPLRLASRGAGPRTGRPGARAGEGAKAAAAAAGALAGAAAAGAAGATSASGRRASRAAWCQVQSGETTVQCTRTAITTITTSTARTGSRRSTRASTSSCASRGPPYSRPRLCLTW